MTQLSVWKNIQEGDSIHTKLKQLILTWQLPEHKKTKGDNTKIKLLHNLYTQGKLILKDNLFLVRTPQGHFNDFAISVPPSLYPGIAYAMHIRLDHPSKAQLSSLLQRYFYTPGWKSIADSISDSCHQCKSLKKLPKVLLDSTHTEVSSVGSKASLASKYSMNFSFIIPISSSYIYVLIVWLCHYLFVLLLKFIRHVSAMFRSFRTKPSVQ